MAGTDRIDELGPSWGAVFWLLVLATASLATGAAAHASSDDHGTLTFHDSADGPAQSSPGGVDDPVEVTCEFWIRGTNLSHAQGTILAHHDLSSRHAHTHEPVSWNASDNGSEEVRFELGPLTLHEEDIWEIQTTTGDREHSTRLHRVEYEACSHEGASVSSPSEHVPDACLSDVRAEARQNGDVALAWNATGADGVHLYRATSGEIQHLAATNESTYVDEATEAHATYQYRVTTSDDVDVAGCPAVTVTAIPVFTSPVALALSTVGGVALLVAVQRSV